METPPTLVAALYALSAVGFLTVAWLALRRSRVWTALGRLRDGSDGSS
ncbi:MAG: hypothetical protein ABEI75_05600 [Halobaculum sp.]